MKNIHGVFPWALIGLIGIFAGSNAASQEKGDLLKGVTFEQSENAVQKETDSGQELQTQQFDSGQGLPFSCEGLTDKSEKDREVHAACLNALEENFTYESERLKHRKWVFRFQLIATNISFLIVVIMVGFGLRFAQIQFSREFTRFPSDIMPRDSSVPVPVTDIEISLARIKVSSSILGVIVLGLAMGFFYLYIRYVFPIQGVM